MHAPFPRRTTKRGLSPGSLVFTGQRKVERLRLSLFRYTETGFEERECSTLEDLLPLMEGYEGNIWLNVEGLHDVEFLASIGQHFGIHNLTMEDVLHVGQRPKIEEGDEYLYVVLRMMQTNQDIHDEQVSFILSNHILITFQEKEGDVFSFVRQRIREGKGYVRRRGHGYLLYALMDAVVDEYFGCLERYGDRMEVLEEDMLRNPDSDNLARLHRLRRDLAHLRRAVYPLREVMSRMEKLDEKYIPKNTKMFVRDLYDHILQVIEAVEHLREIAASMLDLYMNSLSHRMNNVMKVLTIIATIFIPLTFIVGVYGMNFENMPELEWEWGYFGVLGLMLLISLLMLYAFRRRKWL